MNSSRMWIECRTLVAKQTVLRRSPNLSQLRDDVADQFRPVHAVGELALDVVAVPDVNAVQIRIDRRIDAGRDEVALLDQLADLRALDHRLEDAAEAAAVATARRCGEAEQDRIGIARR